MMSTPLHRHSPNADISTSLRTLSPNSNMSTPPRQFLQNSNMSSPLSQNSDVFSPLSQYSEVFSPFDQQSPNTDMSTPPHASSPNSSSKNPSYKGLFPGSPISKDEGWYLIMSYGIQNHLSYKAIINLLELLNKLCPAPNDLPPSFYVLKQHYHHLHGNYFSKKFCSVCESEVASKATRCINNHCHQKKAELCQYIGLSCEQNIKEIYEGNLHYNHTTTVNNPFLILCS